METTAEIIIGDSRFLPEIADGSVDLVVTSPPYWQIKDYGNDGQIGHGQSLHEYLLDLYRVWQECRRALRPGSRLCINVGDQFARASVYGRYRIIPLHAEMIAQCQHLGLDFMGSIIWRKKTTMNTSGGAPIMGSFPFPPNGLLEIDYEHILIFKKPGPPRRMPREVREAARLSLEEWKELFSGHWCFAGARQKGHEAMFPEELPRRLIRMFSFPGDTVLDPFLGSGTTAAAALSLGRKAIGCEINPDFLLLIRKKLGLPEEGSPGDVFRNREAPAPPARVDYRPAIPDASAPMEAQGPPPPETHRVSRVAAPDRLVLEGGQEVCFLGLKITGGEAARAYLERYLLGKEVILRPGDVPAGPGPYYAYVYLKNRLFINTRLIKSGLADPDPDVEHRLKAVFLKALREREGDRPDKDR